MDIEGCLIESEVTHAFSEVGLIEERRWNIHEITITEPVSAIGEGSFHCFDKYVKVGDWLLKHPLADRKGFEHGEHLSDMHPT